MGVGKSEAKVYNYLQTKIEQGVLGPNTKIVETELATTLNLSRSPVRRAIQRLAGEGYLQIEANKGAVVNGKPLSRQDYLDQLQVFELLLIQFMFQLENKRLPWSYPDLAEDMKGFKNLLKGQDDLAKTEAWALEILAKSLTAQKNQYYQKIILETAANLLRVTHLKLDLDNWQVFAVFQRHLEQWLNYLTVGEFAHARREVRIFVNELTLAVIDQQDLNNLSKYDQR